MTPLTQAAVRAATERDRDRLLATLTRAFADDPAVRWLYPERDRYLRHFPRFANALGGRAVDAGTALCDEDRTAAALWLPPGVGPDEDALLALLRESAPDGVETEVLAVLEEMGRFHPGGAHWYLPLIGVDPARQGRGLGSVLLEAELSRCDRERLPAYLESTNPRNQPLYERHGFEAMGVIRVGSCPPIVPMLREPRRP